MKLGFWRRLRCVMVAPWAPEFWEQFPKEDKPGPWMVEVIVRGIAFSHVKKWEKVKGGMWDASIRARELAVEVDMELPRHPEGEVGVEWGIRKPMDKDWGDGGEYVTGKRQ